MLRVFHSLRDYLFKAPESPAPVESSWYVGMAASPIEFSQQLARLQVSLQGETVSESDPISK